MVLQERYGGNLVLHSDYTSGDLLGSIDGVGKKREGGLLSSRGRGLDVTLGGCCLSF